MRRAQVVIFRLERLNAREHLAAVARELLYERLELTLACEVGRCGRLPATMRLARRVTFGLQRCEFRFERCVAWL